MKQIYLVTGAAGFLGSNVCRKLIENSHEVRGLVLDGDKYAGFVPKGTDVYFGNICKEESMDAFFDVPEGTSIVLIHCASLVTVNPDYRQSLIDVNVIGTENLIHKCLKHKGVCKMVYVGSTGAINELPHGESIAETDSYDADAVVGWYSKSKAMASQLVMDAVKNRGLDACIVHPAGIMGPDDFSNSTTSRMLLEILQGKMQAGMKGKFNLCDVRDLASGCIAAAEKGMKGESYILGNEEVTLKQLCGLLKNETGCKPIRFYMPLSLAAFMARKMEKRAKKTGKQPLMTTFAVYNLARNNNYDYTKAVRELGYRSRPYSETIRDQVRWYISSGQYHK